MAVALGNSRNAAEAAFRARPSGLAEQFTLRVAAFCKVPVLKDGDVTVWDSLAICEYISEQYLDGRGWPADVAARAEARACSAEMHSGFATDGRSLTLILYSIGNVCFRVWCSSIVMYK